ncbi:MAG: Gfo/Idh/MocA family protein [Candidatus Enteromonas sp.]
MLRFAILGFGNRGRLFADFIQKDPGAEIVAVVDNAESARKAAKELYGIKEENIDSSADAFFARGKIADAIFLCTQDADHYDMAMKAMALGYDLCLEKPAAITEKDCVAIRDEANRLGRKIMLTHVLRYAPFFTAIKAMIDEGKLGEIVTINQTENIAFWHFGLSYVRGPWRNMEESSPTIIAKCCHDLDILCWLMGKKCESVSSFGGLYYYRPEHAPKGSAAHCKDCDPAVKAKCLYNAYLVYPIAMKNKPVGGTASFYGQDVIEILDKKEHPISRCVFHGDNDAVDHQVVNMLFADGSTAHLTMTAFSQECTRTIRVHGTEGDVYGDLEDGILHYTRFGSKMEDIDPSKLPLYNDKGLALNDGHGGGDYYLYRDFVNYLTTNEPSRTRTTIDASIESHVIGFKAEESRLSGGKAIKID